MRSARSVQQCLGRRFSSALRTAAAAVTAGTGAAAVVSMTSEAAEKRSF